MNKLAELGEIEFEHLFVDGTKIAANANKYSFVWKKSTNKYEARLLDKLDKAYTELCTKYMIECENYDELLNELKARVNFPFVHDRGKRKTELQRDIEQLSEMLNRKSTKNINQPLTEETVSQRQIPTLHLCT